MRNISDMYALARDVFVSFPDLTVTGLHGIPYDWRSSLAQFLTRIETRVLVFGGLFVCGMGFVQLLRRRYDDSQRKTATMVLALWLAVPFLMISQKGLAVAHHFELVYPALFLAGAVLLSSALSAVGTLSKRWSAYGRASVYVAVALIIIAQVDFHRRAWRAIETLGALRWDSGERAAVGEIMPIRYKKQLVHRLTQDLSFEESNLFRRIHGFRFQDLLEDKGYFFGLAKGDEQNFVRQANFTEFHYIIGVGNEVGESALGDRVIAVGPYVIKEYRPRIDYGAWICAEVDAKLLPSGVGPWFPVQIPTAAVPDLRRYWTPPPRSWRSLPIDCRGNIIGTEPSQLGTVIVTSMRTASFAARNDNVVTLLVNGTERPVRRTTTHLSFGAYSRDSVFELKEQLPHGRNSIVIRIDGRNLDFDLDVYEIANYRK